MPVAGSTISRPAPGLAVIVTDGQCQGAPRLPKVGEVLPIGRCARAAIIPEDNHRICAGDSLGIDRRQRSDQARRTGLTPSGAAIGRPCLPKMPEPRAKDHPNPPVGQLNRRPARQNLRAGRATAAAARRSGSAAKIGLRRRCRSCRSDRGRAPRGRAIGRSAQSDGRGSSSKTRWFSGTQRSVSGVRRLPPAQVNPSSFDHHTQVPLKTSLSG